jgi:hypothetical protein
VGLKELIFTEGNQVSLQHIDDGDAVYRLLNKQNAALLDFRVPKEDLRGATFKLWDSPKVFMRWIRKELERQEDEQKMIEQARKDWAEGKQY